MTRGFCFFCAFLTAAVWSLFIVGLWWAFWS